MAGVTDKCRNCLGNRSPSHDSLEITGIRRGRGLTATVCCHDLAVQALLPPLPPRRRAGGPCLEQAAIPPTATLAVRWRLTKTAICVRGHASAAARWLLVHTGGQGESRSAAGAGSRSGGAGAGCDFLLSLTTRCWQARVCRRGEPALAVRMCGGPVGGAPPPATAAPRGRRIWHH